MEVSLKNALILEPFDRFKKFKRLNWLEYNFLLIGHTVRFKLSTRQRDQRDKIPKKQVCWNYLEIGPYTLKQQNIQHAREHLPLEQKISDALKGFT